MLKQVQHDSKLISFRPNVLLKGRYKIYIRLPERVVQRHKLRDCKRTVGLRIQNREFDDSFSAKNCTLLTLLIAESKPEEMEIMKQIVVSVLNKGENYAIY